ncbi:class I SAM-dependent methyltransferase [Sandaracinus amylolyticus]|uniref:Methyltransferase type 11 domain-containing protein n=1 Tax=Sandaracinus amylolyticus TaxID=927083 RepID=A0A0F6SE80_9BACT|nr:class I SAM-dependent methyltransferase [Sandaracinus amylolyticus]AKF04729.1 hypothetical protein DB32_001878 [Sandaracinus amylolyticus]
MSVVLRFDRARTHSSEDRFHDLAFARIVREIGAKPGDEIFDAGCGDCTNALRFARLGLRVKGVDVSHLALERARSRIARERAERRVSVSHGDVRALRVRDRAFRFASCWSVLMHVPHVERALDELARVLAKHGRLAIMERTCESLQARTWDRAVRLLRRHRLERTARGLEEWREEGLLVRGFDPAWLCEHLDRRGLSLVARFAGQLTEVEPLARVLGDLYFSANAPARFAHGNVFVFEKRS